MQWHTHRNAQLHLYTHIPIESDIHNYTYTQWHITQFWRILITAVSSIYIYSVQEIYVCESNNITSDKQALQLRLQRFSDWKMSWDQGMSNLVGCIIRFSVPQILYTHLLKPLSVLQTDRLYAIYSQFSTFTLKYICLFSTTYLKYFARLYLVRLLHRI